MSLSYRLAIPQDTAACVEIRGKTRENAFSVEQLRAVGVTVEGWREGIAAGNIPGWVGLDDDVIVGYCFGDKATGEILVVALLPEWEGKGIGKRLLGRMVEDLAEGGFRRLFLSCSADPGSRSYGFYRHLGWRSTGVRDGAGDEVLEYFPEGWQ